MPRKSWVSEVKKNQQRDHKKKSYHQDQAKHVARDEKYERLQQDQFAIFWIGMMKRMRKYPRDEQRKQAKYQMTNTIEEMKVSEEELRSDLRAIALEVKRSRNAQMKSDLNQLLRTSKSKRERLAMLGRQRQTLEQHCEALSSVELNEKVMSSVKNTSTVLKSLGLSQQVGELDETMLDLQESSQEVHDMNEALGQSMGLSNTSDDDLEAELDLLMNGEDPCATVLNQRPVAVAPMAPHSMQQNSASTAMAEAEDVSPAAVVQAEEQLVPS